jgi:predicted Zn-dependent protease
MTEQLPAHARSAADNAIKMWRSGEPDAALRVLLPLADSHPEAFTLKAIIGFIYYETDRLLEAYPYIKQVSDAQPNRKLIARVLFHILDKLGMDAEAIDQADRLANLTGRDDDEEMFQAVAARGTRSLN